MEQLKSQLRLAVVKGLIQRSANYANIRIICGEGYPAILYRKEELAVHKQR